MWRPIDTAPKDETKILVTDGEEIWMATWCMFAEWFAECGTDAPGLSADQLSDITLWMPLPELPK